MKDKIEEELDKLHKRIWSSREFNPRRFEEYALAVIDYRRNGFDVSKQELLVEAYRVMLIESK